MSTHRATEYGEFFTLFGGIIALSGFSMPWTSISSAYKFFVTPRFNSTSRLITIAFIASVVIFGISYSKTHNYLYIGEVRNADRKCKAFSLRSKIGFPRVGNQIWVRTPQNLASEGECGIVIH